LSIRAIKSRIDAGKLFVNGKIERFSSRKVKYKDKIEFFIEDLKKDSPLLLINKDSILFENKHIIAVFKPARYLSNHLLKKITVEESVKKYLKKQNHFFCVLLHRLDKDTSGVLLFAKTLEGRDFYLKQFKERNIKKTYHAIVSKIPEKNKGEIKSFIGKISQDKHFSKWGNVDKKMGKRAITFYKIKKTFKNYSLLELKLLTGRTHQIRIHLQTLGTPVIGDPIYLNQKTTIIPPRLMLHASEIIIPLINEDDKITIKAPFPEDFNNILKII